jgi:GDP-L-fucose synthase
MTKILVTGGTGLVGQAIYNQHFNLNNSVEWLFLKSSECDLRFTPNVEHLFDTFQPNIVIHLAAKVGGLYANMTNNYNMLMDNIKINTNILDACKKYKIKRLINILSTCVFPDKNVSYPLTSDQMLNGEPSETNYGYSYSKRLLSIGSKLLTKESDTIVINLIPTNLYGENDNYNLINSHVIPGIIHKCYKAEQNNSNLFIKGSGKGRRQFMYANDFANIIIQFINLPLTLKFNSLIVSPPIDTEMCISDLVNYIVSEFEFKKLIVYDRLSSDGQISKTCSDRELKKYLPNFKFTPFRVGLHKTIKYFKNNYKTVRK